VDNLSHTLAGLALARAGVGRGAPGTTAALVIASNLPDADIVTSLFGTASYLEHHRGLSHSVVGAPLLALGLALALSATVRESRFVTLLLCSLAGVGGHVFMDLWTSYGTRVFAPFDGSWYTWDLVFIVDPFVWALLMSAVLVEVALRRRGSPMGAPAAAVVLGLLLTYVGARAILHAQALDEVRHVLPASAAPRVALPSPFTPFVWRIVADDGAAFYTGEIDLGRGPRPLERRPKRAEDRTVAKARAESPSAAVFLAFARFPWLEVSDTAEGGTAVSWRDLRFESVPGLGRLAQVSPPRERFVARVVFGPDGRMRSESIRF
jgi:inner membrane protein